MLIECDAGSFPCASEMELERTLREQANLPMDDIWIATPGRKHPSLVILRHGDLACVHYFGENDMFQSCGDMEADGTVAFRPGGEVSELPAYTAIPWEDAVASAREFFRTGMRPACLRWNEL